MKKKFTKKGHFKDFKDIKVEKDEDLTGAELFKKYSRRELAVCFVKNQIDEKNGLITRDDVEKATEKFLKEGGEIRKIEYQEKHKEKNGLIIGSNSEDDDDDYSVNYSSLSFKVESALP